MLQKYFGFIPTVNEFTKLLPAYGCRTSTIVQHPQKAGEKKENLISQSTYTWNDIINIGE
jgi:hypothetical protein